MCFFFIACLYTTLIKLIKRENISINLINFQFRGKASKFALFHILGIVRLWYDKNHCIVVLAKYPFIFKKNANNRKPSKLSFETPNSLHEFEGLARNSEGSYSLKNS